MTDFGRLLEREIPRLRRYGRALTHDVFRADDLVQDTLVRAIAQQHRWHYDSNLQAWLFTLMHNQNVNGVRRSNNGTITHAHLHVCACVWLWHDPSTGVITDVEYLAYLHNSLLKHSADGTSHTT
jgi:DNA-directed RNA polymerase specialized sigma24 family protein